MYVYKCTCTVCMYTFKNNFILYNVASQVLTISVSVAVGAVSFGLIIALVITAVCIYIKLKTVKQILEGTNYILLFYK